MIKLLNSNFYRLKKSMSFWVMLIIMGFLGMFIYNNYNPIDCGNCDYNRIGEVFFVFPGFVFILLPIFTSLFLGTEYSDGGIKNKVIKGHTRTNIYLSNLLTSIIVTFIYSIIFIIFANIMGLIWGNHIAISPSAFIIILLNSIMLNIFTASLFTFISMSISNKTSQSIIAFATIVWSVMISSDLLAKVHRNLEPLKSIYQFFVNLIPYGQATQIIDLCNVQDGKILELIDLTKSDQTLWIYSLCLIIIINFYGIMIINKKELN